MLVVGSVYENPDLLLDYGELIIPKYDFYHDTARDLYNWIYELYQSYANENITEVKVNIFMNQNEERKQKYTKLGGYNYIKRIMNLVDINDFEKYYNDLKKYSLLREFERKGFPAQKIFEKNNFSKVSAEEILKGMEYQVLTIGTVIGGVEDSIRLGADITNVYEGWKKKPDFGIDIPFPIWNQLIRGWRKKKLNLTGMHSGFGKSRITSKIACYIGIKLKQPLLIMVNEQDKDEWDAMILSAVINNPEFGFNNNRDSVKIDETKIVTGTCSPEEDEICLRASKWIEENTKIDFLTLNQFDTNTLKRQIKRHKIRGCNYFIYDTLKSPDHDWVSFVKTGDMLKQICKEFDMGGWATFQLTDDSLFDEMLTSRAIASGKHIKHIADGLFMAKPIPKTDYDKYEIKYLDTDFTGSLDKTKDYYYLTLDKNRGGKDKKNLVFHIDKGRNLWQECGFLIESETQREFKMLKKQKKILDTEKQVTKLQTELGK